MPGKKKTRDFLERGVTHDIDEAAQRIFKSAIPMHWIENKLVRDYGKDYLIEISNAITREITGKTIYVQLKGVDGANYLYDSTVVAHKLELRHLTYYCDEIKEPVFLVVVDVQTKKGYWLFLQQYLASKKEWRSRKTYTLHIPVANDLADHIKLESEADRAIKYMRILSATTRERLDFDIQQLEAKDPRFQVIPTITRETTKYQLKALKPVAFSLTLKAPPKRGSDLADDLIGKGQAVPFAPGEVEFTGSPLFEEFNEVGGILRIVHKFDATVTLICLDEEGKEVARSMEIQGVVEGGRDEKHFRSKESRSPVEFEFGPLTQGKGGSVKIRGDSNVWKDQPLRLASYFELTHRLFTALVEHNRLIVECHQQGNLIFKVTMRMDNLEKIRPFVNFLDVLDKARKVARHFNLNPVYSEEIWKDDESVDEIITAYNVVFNNSHQVNPENHVITVTFTKSEAEKIVKQDVDLAGLKLYTSVDFKLPFMGNQLALGRLAVEATNVRMDLTVESLQQLLQEVGDGVKIPYVCSKSSSYVLRQLTDAEKEDQQEGQEHREQAN
ncbi:Putative uncharacterized protein OS=Desulfotomaculum carboxydivorans (strain DSM 14880 / VKM B-2319 / CO-1-SRB) GN=Desca_0945 PE=4 SV=1: DUF4365 [Tuwongella immobilis]|uniref:DUF4365 domain-containing protein n=2 Tax=Tuwongella immobilis TaxID=692036 RepID=A0A6C2YQR4_9BACT|nr:Putative uncharacterized protein OS=Desulfotomaculum carboxydivorans (strain DSM 14880 / VKM B-2319 / CO-1-SRB) GN=Desca_0945 PE=4 SV=1: DUF4365 [Tuwongella immobilis]VTS05343.1 Putative uncharacterized protein OS=Desulfotomaculum carboxydivorans (strain DSM 14880 / VKM B-2319 / CO-1-SRB) GN=Desca_0945 PE=4 SV=1: DUF4365 [Tuwongella immobilis]